ncbi:MAG: ATP-binding protein [Chloroflexi bacterium]|nr:ATP-binding protein [Chloroflexota bacterium]
MSVPFVGRQSELGVLISIVRGASSLRVPTAALVVGEPGSGKSRLLRELIAREALAISIRVVGFEPMQSVPLAAAGALLRHLAKVPGDGAILDRLVFRGHATEDRDPLRIFEAAHRALASQGPVLIAIDDLQWVDERSLALIQ